MGTWNCGGLHPVDCSRSSATDSWVCAAPDQATPAVLLSLGLTPREAEVLFWVSEGKTNAEVGVILDSAKRTVEKHVEHILEKLGVENRAAALREALRVRGMG